MELEDAMRIIDRRGGRRNGEVAVRPYDVQPWPTAWTFRPGRYVATDDGINFGIYEYGSRNDVYLIRRCDGRNRDADFCFGKSDWQPFPPRYTIVFSYDGVQMQKIRYMEPLRNSPDFFVDLDKFWLGELDKKKKR